MARFFGVIAALCLAALSWCTHADAQVTVLKASKEIVWKDFLGVNAHLMWFSPAICQKQITNLKLLGLEWVRLDLHWDQLEIAQNQFTLGLLDPLVTTLEANQIKTLFYLVGSARFATTAPPFSLFQDQFPPKDPYVFADRMAMLSRRYPSVAAWQVWNEPNLVGFWRPAANPPGFVTLLQATAQALRAVDPSKPVVAAGMAFLSEMPNGQSMLDAIGVLGAFSLNTQNVVSLDRFGNFLLLFWPRVGRPAPLGTPNSRCPSAAQFRVQCVGFAEVLEFRWFIAFGHLIVGVVANRCDALL